jgi:hypothetical protein
VQTRNFSVTEINGLWLPAPNQGDRAKVMEIALPGAINGRSRHEKPEWIGIFGRVARTGPLQKDRTLELLRVWWLPLRPSTAPLFAAKLRDRTSFDS